MSPRLLIPALRLLGPRWVAFRVRYALQQKRGLQESSSPLQAWSDLGAVARPTGTFFSAVKAPGSAGSRVDTADQILAGEFPFFFDQRRHLGERPDWHRNPLTSEQADPAVHWSQLGDFNHGDIKQIWEPSRFGWAFPLVRAFASTRRERYAERFWVLFEDWMENNPPNHGINWRCGQEAAIRLLAVIYASRNLAEAAATTPERLAKVDQLALATGRRIEANLDYALSQKNNHGLSEANGLWTISLLYPDFAESSRWRELGRTHLRDQAVELIYEDGGTSQHSFNYARVMIDTLSWALALGGLNGEEIGEGVVTAALRRATGHLAHFCDPETGVLPNFGSNDGAQILPIGNRPYRDYRPSLQTAWIVSTGARLYPVDPAIDWMASALLGDLPWLVNPPNLASKEFAHAGLTHLHDASGNRVLIRLMEQFRHRPAHADQLHVDFTWRGRNVLADPGSFSYNAEPPFDGGLKETSVHNTIEVAGESQMTKAGRFLWLPWCRGRSEGLSEPHSGVQIWSGQHDGYTRLKPSVTHRRTVAFFDEVGLLVVDELDETIHDARLRWLLGEPADSPFEIRVFNPRRGEISWRRISPDEESALGWVSDHYSQRRAAEVVECVVDEGAVLTWAGLPGAFEPTEEGGIVRGNGREWRVVFTQGEAKGVQVAPLSAS